MTSEKKQQVKTSMMRTVVTLVIFLTIMSCRVSEFYTRKELRTQIVPKDLMDRTWTLKAIYGEQEPAKSIATDFLQNGNCPFTYQFADKGELLVNFKGHPLSGTYLIEGNGFKHIHGGWREKILWNINPECKVTPTELAYIFYGAFKFQLNGNTLELQNDQGSKFIFEADNN